MRAQQIKMSLSLVFLLAASASANSPAHANGFVGNTKDLPDASHIYQAKRRADIVDTRMEVVDMRRASDETTYEINVPPPPTGHRRIVRIGGDSTTNGANNPDESSIHMVHPDLPYAGPQSNISAGHGIARQLPPGQTGHTMATAGQINPKKAEERIAAAPEKAPASGTSSPKVLLAAPYATSGGSASSSTSTKVDLKGSLIKRSAEK